MKDPNKDRNYRSNGRERELVAQALDPYDSSGNIVDLYGATELEKRDYVFLERRDLGDSILEDLEDNFPKKKSVKKRKSGAPRKRKVPDSTYIRFLKDVRTEDIHVHSLGFETDAKLELLFRYFPKAASRLEGLGVYGKDKGFERIFDYAVKRIEGKD